MNAEEFRKAGKDIVDFIVDYVENIRSRDPLPQVEQGYLHKLLPDSAPQSSEKWSQIQQDFHEFIMPGVTHWSSPLFAAYFPTVPSYSSILGEIMAAGLGAQGFNWIACPANTELEVIVLDWLAKMMDLPRHFLASEAGPGGGVIHSSASEGILVALLAAREWMTKKISKERPNLDEAHIRGRLVLYASDQSNSSIEKAGKLGAMITRLLPCDADGCLRLETLRASVQEDVEQGLFPCYVVVTLGSTSFCSFDDLKEIGPYCTKQQIWCHVDAAYAGASFICPELRHYMSGIEHADSFNINPHKWLSISFDCSAFWIKDRSLLINALSVESVYLKDIEASKLNYAPEFRHWEISLGRRFRSLKLWFTLRSYGVSGLQTMIRSNCNLANYFKQLVLDDHRFTVFSPTLLSLVSFRLKGDNELTRALLQEILKGKKLFMVGTEIHGTYYIRYAVCSHISMPKDVENAWVVIQTAANYILSTLKS